MNKSKVKQLNFTQSYTVMLTMIIILGNGWIANAKSFTADEEQAKLMQKINAGQKFHQLTVKEAYKLRKDLARVARKKAKMLDKANRKLTDENKAELIKDLNDISSDIHKLELEKRTK